MLVYTIHVYYRMGTMIGETKGNKILRKLFKSPGGQDVITFFIVFVASPFYSYFI